MAGYNSVLSMMSGSPSATASVPTQTFNAANILGTAVPRVGDNAARPNYAGGVGSLSSKQIAIVAVILFATGYLLYHLNFEK